MSPVAVHITKRSETGSLFTWAFPDFLQALDVHVFLDIAREESRVLSFAAFTSLICSIGLRYVLLVCSVHDRCDLINDDIDDGVAFCLSDPVDKDTVLLGTGERHPRFENNLGNVNLDVVVFEIKVLRLKRCIDLDKEPSLHQVSFVVSLKLNSRSLAETFADSLL
jgi:hypothetical protein